MFEVDQKVWDVIRGRGVVVRIKSGHPYPVSVKFADENENTYLMSGKFRADHTIPSLYPYPVEIVKKVVKPSINWEHVRGEYKFLAQFANGKAYLFREEPELSDDEDYWIPTLGGCHAAHTYNSYTPGTCDCKDSLVARPKDA